MAPDEQNENVENEAEETAPEGEEPEAVAEAPADEPEQTES